MNLSRPDVEVPGEDRTSSAETTGERLLPSGRSVIVKVAGQREELEIRSAEGEVEVRITLTEQGPVVSLRGGRLELEAPDTVAVHCRRFEVNTTEETQLQSSGPVHITGQEMFVETKSDIHLKGAIIRLN